MTAPRPSLLLLLLLAASPIVPPLLDALVGPGVAVAEAGEAETTTTTATTTTGGTDVPEEGGGGKSGGGGGGGGGIVGGGSAGEAVDGDDDPGTCASSSSSTTTTTAAADEGRSGGRRSSSSSSVGGDGRRSEPLPVLDGLFPRRSLDGAWESHPLLSTAHPSLILGAENGGGIVPAVFAGPVGPSDAEASDVGDRGGAEEVRSRRVAAFRSLISLDHIHSVLSQPDLIHTEDFQLVKKIVRDGQEWNGMPPARSMSPEQAARLFDLGGFSLVVNAMQRRRESVAALSREVQRETGADYVSCNLYATPSVLDGRPPSPGAGGGGGGPSSPVKLVDRRSGFETHWDWMDVIVLQVSGSKLWSVASRPIVHLSTRDLKRKPTVEEMDEYVGPGGRHREFLLRPGDALYVPRGWLHNASTVGPGEGLTESPLLPGGGGGDDDDDDGGAPPRLEPSLHLTLGIEHTCETTYEALVQHAIHLYGRRTERGREAAVSGRRCGGTASGEDVPWHALLALAASDVARRGCGGAGEGYEDIAPPSSWSWSSWSSSSSWSWSNWFSSSEEDKKGAEMTEEGWRQRACVLRESVPRGAAWREIAAAFAGTRRNSGDENDGGSEGGAEDGPPAPEGAANESDDDDEEVDPLRTSYSVALSALLRLASPAGVASFLRRLLALAREEDALDAYCLPLLRNLGVLECPLGAVAELDPAEFGDAVRDFVRFAEESYAEVSEHFERHLEERRAAEWRRDDRDLTAIGQAIAEGEGRFSKLLLGMG